MTLSENHVVSKTANIFDLYRGTTHDGPGLRTTVFFAGCSLTCEWCHNPEGICFQPKVWHDERQCIGCFQCLSVCKLQALSAAESGIRVDDQKCNVCRDCIKICPSKALEMTNHTITIDELTKEVLKDQAYYEKSGGGVTASGGECMLQAEFIKDFFRELKSLGVNTAIDTSGQAPFSSFLHVLPITDYILYDIKLMDETEHIRYTGQSNKLILENLNKIAALIKGKALQSKLIIRTPLIPEATATIRNIQSIADYLVSSRVADSVDLWELCAFNSACASKYARLGKDWAYNNVPLLCKEFAESLLGSVSRYDGLASKTRLTGILY